MLDLYIAEPGNGKGYLLCEAAIRLLKMGRDVIIFLDGVKEEMEHWDALEPDKGQRMGNLTVVDSEWLENELNYPVFGKDKEILDNGGMTPGCVLIVEEAYLFYANPREINKEAGEKPLHPRIVTFFRQHRHFSKRHHDGSVTEMDIILDAQDLMALHPSVRRVTRKTYVPFNLVDRGMPNKIQLTEFKKAAVTGQRKTLLVSKDMSVHKYYHSTKGGATTVHKVDTQKRGGYWRWYHKLYFVLPVGAIGAVAWAGPGAYRLMTTGHSQAQPVATASAQLTAKPLCNGSGVILDLTKRRVFYKGKWASVQEMAIADDGRAVWDVGPCRFRFGV